MRMFRFALCVMTAVVAAPALGNNIVTNGSFANPPHRQLYYAQRVG